MSDVMVSVIIPVYNSVTYFRQMLDSVVGQTLQEIEIICVDDGSTDDSLSVLQEYASRDSRIQILQQANQYAGAARNHGLQSATGKYVIFWDADDFFELNALEMMYEQAERDSAEIVVCGANRYNTQLDETVLTNVYLVKERLPEKRPFSRQDIGKYIFYFATNVPWNKMYLRSFISEHELQFEARKKANDTYFVLMAFYYAKRITVVEANLINYRISYGESITTSTLGQPLCAYESYVSVLKKLRDMEDYSGDVEQSFTNRALSGFMTALENQNSFDDYRILYEHLVKTGFHEFGIDQHAEDYYFSPWMYEDYMKMQKMSPENFILSKFKDKSDELKVKNSRVRKLKERREELKQRREELKEELSIAKKTIREQKCILESRTVRYALKLKQIVTWNGRLGKKREEKDTSISA